MTHRDGSPRLSARSAWRGGVRRRKPRAPSTSIGPPESPRPQDLGKPPPVARASRQWTPLRRREALPMTHIARGSPPARPLARPLARRIARAISMGHYQRFLV